MPMVLEDVKVLDFSRFVSGPYATMLLADMGAEVIKVERPGGSDDRELGPHAPGGQSLPYGIILARNKKGITLDIKRSDGAWLLEELVRRCDVLVHNFAVGSPEAAILSYDRMSELNPAIVEAAITGFGQYGPYASRGCFDMVAQGMSAAMSYAGFPGNPPTRAAVPVADLGVATHAALGIVLALYHRKSTGRGQLVDAALLDTMVSFVNVMGVAAEYKLLDFIRPQQGNNSYHCFADLFRTSDGWVSVNVMSDSIWRRFCRAIAREEWTSDERFKDNEARYQNKHLLAEFVSQWMSQRSTSQALGAMEKAHVPSGNVNSIPQMVADPHIHSRNMLPEPDFPGVGPVPMPGVTPKLSDTPGDIRRRAPTVGEHNEEVYHGLLGLDSSRLEDLRHKGVI